MCIRDRGHPHITPITHTKLRSSKRNYAISEIAGFGMFGSIVAQGLEWFDAACSPGGEQTCQPRAQQQQYEHSDKGNYIDCRHAIQRYLHRATNQVSPDESD